MKYRIFAFLALTIGSLATSSFTTEIATVNADDKTYFKYLIHLNDKNGTPFSIDKPEAFLSAKAIERRKKQGAVIDETDLPVTPAYIEKIASVKNVKVLYASKWLNGVVVQVSHEYDVDPIEDFAFVKKVQLLGKYTKKEVEKDKKPAKDDFNEDAGESAKEVESVRIDLTDIMKRGYGRAYYQNRMINMLKVHDMGYYGEGMTIAVIDGGFKNYYRHRAFDSLRANNQIIGHRNFVNDDTTINNNGSHGMSVLSCIGANSPGIMIGTAPKASFWLLESEDAGSESSAEETNWARAAEFADSVGADIITSSLGYRDFDDDNLNYTYKDLNGKKALSTKAAALAAKKGIMVLIAAGNEGDGKKWKYINAPADADGILAVGGVDIDREHTNFSSLGPAYDNRVKPELCAQATNVYVTSPSNNFEMSQGTSFATPIMAGAVACLMQANPTKTTNEIIAALKQSGDHNHNPDNYYGNGIPDVFIAHSILNNNPYFDYTKEKLMNPAINDFTDRIFYRFYSPTAQDVTIMLTYKGGKKEKVVYNKVHTVAAQGYLQGDIPKVSKLKYGEYVLTLTTANGTVYTRKIERIEPRKGNYR